MRSLRNEFEQDEDNSKRFGGYGLIIHRDNMEAEYQKSKEGGKVPLSDKKLPDDIPDDKPVTIKWSVRDVDDKIEVKASIKYDGDSEFKEVINISNTNYEDIARDKKQFHKSGVVWIRINGDDEELGTDDNKRAKHPNEIPIRDVSIIELKD